MFNSKEGRKKENLNKEQMTTDDRLIPNRVSSNIKCT